MVIYFEEFYVYKHNFFHNCTRFCPKREILKRVPIFWRSRITYVCLIFKRDENIFNTEKQFAKKNFWWRLRMLNLFRIRPFQNWFLFPFAYEEFCFYCNYIQIYTLFIRLFRYITFLLINRICFNKIGKYY